MLHHFDMRIEFQPGQVSICATTRELLAAIDFVSERVLASIFVRRRIA